MVSVGQRILRFENASFISVEGLLLEGARGRAIHIEGGRNIDILDSKIRNIGGIGVHTERSWNTTVRGCAINQVRQERPCSCFGRVQLPTLAPADWRRWYRHQPCLHTAWRRG